MLVCPLIALALAAIGAVPLFVGARLRLRGDVRQRSKGFAIMTCALPLAALFLVPLLLVWNDRSLYFGAWYLPRVAEHGRPLVQAIEAFRADKGYDPYELADLIPKYVSEIPGTGAPSETRWDYWRSSYADPVAEWSLSVEMSYGLVVPRSVIHYATARPHEACEPQSSVDGWTFCVEDD